MKYNYSVIPDSEISTNDKVEAFRALCFARKDLSLPDDVRIKWFRNSMYVHGKSEETFESDNEIFGIFFGKSPNCIYINALLTEPGQSCSIRETVLHETFHLMQLRLHSGHHSETESIAASYAKDALCRMKEAERSGELERIYYDGLCGKDWSCSEKPKEKPKTTPASHVKKHRVREEMIRKSKSFSMKSVDILSSSENNYLDDSDLSLINQYTLEKLEPEDVFTFSVILCDNDVDRDYERFTETALIELAKLFRGKTGIFDHDWSAKNQTARIYDTKVISVPGKKNALGRPLQQLKAKAYMLDNSANQDLIMAIKGGIIKEVSVGFAARICKCSLCGSLMDWTGECEQGHFKGDVVGGSLCVCELSGIADAYEFSFVAVPAQRGAGVSR